MLKNSELFDMSNPKLHDFFWESCSVDLQIQNYMIFNFKGVWGNRDNAMYSNVKQFIDLARQQKSKFTWFCSGIRFCGFANPKLHDFQSQMFKNSKLFDMSNPNTKHNPIENARNWNCVCLQITNMFHGFWNPANKNQFQNIRFLGFWNAKKQDVSKKSMGVIIFWLHFRGVLQVDYFFD